MKNMEIPEPFRRLARIGLGVATPGSGVPGVPKAAGLLPRWPGETPSVRLGPVRERLSGGGLSWRAQPLMPNLWEFSTNLPV